MRKSLFTAAAMAPLMLLAVQGSASAQVTINDDLTTPVLTGTASNGGPADVTISSTGSVTVTTGTAVTVNSNNKFTNQGTIAVNDADNGVGILVLTPHASGDFVNNGAVNVLEDYTAKDTNDDGILDEPFAEGTGRYGIRVMGAGPFTGLFTNSGAVTVEGNNSFGISLESAMVGNVLNSGAVTITGNNSTAFRTTGAITGGLRFQGQVLATGEGAKAIDIGGDISGGLSIYSTIQATGYRITTRPSTPEAVAKLLPANMLEGGPALTIAADVNGGVFIGAPPTIATDAPDTVDNDKDGVPDKQEGTGTILVFGQAPAVVIGKTAENVHLGKFGADENAYGLIVRGRVEGSGVFDGKQANGIQIGTGDGTVDVEGGVRVVGLVRATALKADATAIRLRSGAETPTLRNEGQIVAQGASDVTSTVRAVVIDAGASLGSITNTDTIQAKMVGDKGSATAILDQSGTLTSITNNARILATVQSASDSTSAPTGQAIAIDARANTTGVTINQAAIPIDEDTDTAPVILGDILLGSGNDAVNVRGGVITGALDFGAGSNSILIDNGATYLGAMSTAGTLNIDVIDGRLDNLSATAVASSALHVGADGVIAFAVDPANNKAGQINVAGNAVLDSGAKLGVNILSLPQGTATFTVINAGNLSVGGSDGDLLATTPFLFVTTATSDQAAGTIDLSVRRRTAEEAGFNKAEAAAYDSIYQGLPRDSGILAAFVNQTDRDGLLGVYDQMLPDHAGGVTRALSWSSEAAGRAAADWPRGEASPGPTRGWTQEIGLGESKDRADASAYRIYGFGAVGGIESVSATGGAVGMTAGFTTANVNNPDTPGDDEVGLSQLSLGAYWRGVFGRFHADAQVGAGYVWANQRRELIYADTTQIVHRVATSSWSGYSLYSRAGLQYDYVANRLSITPGVHLDYFRLFQGGYTEKGGGAGFDLDIDSKTSDVLSGTASVVVGYSFGGRTKIRPEIEVGYRQVITGSAGATEGEFVSGGIPFTLFGEPIEGGGPIARIGLRAFNEFLDLRLDAGGEFRDDYTDLDIRLTARVVF
jgi:autotransporter-like protein